MEWGLSEEELACWHQQVPKAEPFTIRADPSKLILFIWEKREFGVVSDSLTARRLCIIPKEGMEVAF